MRPVEAFVLSELQVWASIRSCVRRQSGAAVFRQRSSFGDRYRSSVEASDFSVCQQLSRQRRLSNRRHAPESSISGHGTKLCSIRFLRIQVDWQW